jgi:glutamate formiminotransferase / 5-formyltetrahydrofolate cyclo-ligase
VTVGAGAVLECVPNFSEGRDSGKIRQIILALRQPGVMLLDYSADRDHNRMVVTVAGPPDAVVEGAVRAVGVAAELIDLREHRGVHPRMGAADVVPFVPIQGITLERAAELARLAGREMHRRFGVPVFFYESAAEREEMRRLENVRRGQFEGTAALGKLPDLGGELHASAGAAIVGARNFLVAYNLLLETSDVSIAKQIARRLRESGGGFKSVKALGVEVRGRAQVTVNVTNFHEAPVERVFECVKELATEYGTGIREGELIGLVPEAALAAGTEWTRVIPGYSPETKVLERRLERPMAWPE